MGHQISQGSFCPPLPSFVSAEEDKGLYLVTFVTPYGGHQVLWNLLAWEHSGIKLHTQVAYLLVQSHNLRIIVFLKKYKVRVTLVGNVE